MTCKLIFGTLEQVQRADVILISNNLRFQNTYYLYSITNLFNAIRDILMLFEKYFVSGKNIYLDPFFSIFKIIF